MREAGQSVLSVRLSSVRRKKLKSTLINHRNGVKQEQNLNSKNFSVYLTEVKALRFAGNESLGTRLSHTLDMAIHEHSICDSSPVRWSRRL